MKTKIKKIENRNKIPNAHPIWDVGCTSLIIVVIKNARGDHKLGNQILINNVKVKVYVINQQMWHNFSRKQKADNIIEI